MTMLTRKINKRRTRAKQIFLTGALRLINGKVTEIDFRINIHHVIWWTEKAWGPWGIEETAGMGQNCNQDCFWLLLQKFWAIISPNFKGSGVFLSWNTLAGRHDRDDVLGTDYDPALDKLADLVDHWPSYCGCLKGNNYWPIRFIKWRTYLSVFPLF